jgi:DNA-binding LytR/AlgR family response regulator
MLNSENKKVTQTLFNKTFPKNYLLASAGRGALILFVFCFLFAWIYQPLSIHPSALFNFEGTLLAYSFVISLTAYLTITLLSRVTIFRHHADWNVKKELISIAVVLFAIGNAVFFAAFVLEAEADRWNLATYVDSLFSAFLICSIPFVLFTLINIKTLFENTIELSGEKLKSKDEHRPDMVKLETSLKKDELSFSISKLLFAESDGNYVFLYLITPKGVKREMARVSMNQVSEQLASYPFIFRSHRSYLVNLNHVTSATGNTLGYSLKLNHSEKEIPVSRAQAKAFREVYAQFE